MYITLMLRSITYNICYILRTPRHNYHTYILNEYLENCDYGEQINDSKSKFQRNYVVTCK